jgi:hypothetical protein
MGDLTRHTAATCSKNLGFVREVPGSKPGVSYTVSYERVFGSRHDALGCEYGWTCTCENYKRLHSRLGTNCKHIADVKDQRCTWNAECDPGVYPKDGDRCPACGGPIEYVQVAV